MRGIGQHFILKKTAEKLVSRNLGALKSSIMAVNPHFSSHFFSFLLFTFQNKSPALVVYICAAITFLETKIPQKRQNVAKNDGNSTPFLLLITMTWVRETNRRKQYETTTGEKKHTNPPIYNTGATAVQGHRLLWLYHNKSANLSSSQGLKLSDYSVVKKQWQVNGVKKIKMIF